jgi:uncharacterized OsmC-like protein
LGGALEARGIPAGEGQLWSEATGEVETEDRVLVIKRIHVRYHLRARSEQRDTAERAHGAHQSRCPVARTLRGAVDITTELVLEPEAP